MSTPNSAARLCCASLAASLLVALLAPPGLAQTLAPPPSVPPRPEPKVLGVDVTFLANAGFFLESGKYSVLIDSFLREPVKPYAALPEELYRNIVNAHAPFDGLTLVMVSHDHPDHVQMRGLEKFLTNNNQAQLVTSPEVMEALSGSARSIDTIHRRLTAIRTSPGGITQVVLEQLSFDVFELKHSGKANSEVKNLAYLIEIGGVRLLHVGDAEPARENFRTFNLKARHIDVAFVPYWYFGKPAGMEVLHEEIQARTVVACHVPPSEWQKLHDLLEASFPDVVLFKEPLEKRHFLPAETAAAEPPKPGG